MKSFNEFVEIINEQEAVPGAGGMNTPPPTDQPASASSSADEPMPKTSGLVANLDNASKDELAEFAAEIVKVAHGDPSKADQIIQALGNLVTFNTDLKELSQKVGPKLGAAEQKPEGQPSEVMPSAPDNSGAGGEQGGGSMGMGQGS